MRIAGQLLSWLVGAAFVWIATLGVRDAMRHRDRGRVTRAAALGLLALMSVSGKVNQLSGYSLRAAADVSLVAFALSGAALLEHRATIVRLPAWGRLAGWWACVGVGAATLVARMPMSPHAHPSAAQSAAIAALVFVWSSCVVESAVRFWLAGRGKPAVERARLRLLSAAYVDIVLILVVAVAIADRVRGNDTAALVFQVFAILGVLTLYAAVNPPLFLRRRWLARAGERTLRTVTPVGSWYWDTTVDLLSWSDELYRLHGHQPRDFEATYSGYLERVHPDDRRLVNDTILRAFTAQEAFAVDHRVIRPDGEIRWLHARGEVAIDPATQQTVAMFGTALDITERKEAEEAIRSALQREREASLQLQALDELKDSILVAVSHELRTPLTVVLGLSQTLQRPQVQRHPERWNEFLQRIEANAKKLERLLLNLLDLDRLTRGVIEPLRRPTCLKALAYRVLETSAYDYDAVTLEGDEVSISVDPAHVGRIIENLVSNALRHTPAGTPVSVRVAAAPGGAVLSVDDAGPGVPDQLKETVFEPFLQGNANGHSPRLGVGLSLVARFASLHGGRAWVEDVPGGGASFRVFLADVTDDELVIAAREPLSEAIG